MLYVQDEEPSSWNYQAWFDTSSNLIKYNNNGTIVTVYGCVFGSSITTSSGITSITPKTPFIAVDHNDGSWIAQQAMPSSKYINLTSGASGATYTAPANGYFTFSLKSSSANHAYYSAAIVPSNSEVALLRSHGWIPSTASNSNARGFLPCKKGQRLYLGYYNATIDLLQFTYTEGEI